MHDLFVALSLSILTFMPCIVTMNDEACELEVEEAGAARTANRSLRSQNA